MSATEVFSKVFNEKIDIKREFETKSKLIEAVLPNVAFDGWTLKALDAASESLGLPRIVGRELFEHSPVEMVAHHSRMADKAMLVALEDEDLSKLKIHEKLKRGIELRLRENAYDREAIRRGLSVLAMPTNAALAAKLVWETCDALWLIAGDTSTDYNHYTKRGLLSGVYGSTVQIWLNDESEDLSETMAFLDRRIENVLSVFSTLRKVTGPFDKLREQFKAA